jgi:hypothetical protein
LILDWEQRFICSGCVREEKFMFLISFHFCNAIRSRILGFLSRSKWWNCSDLILCARDLSLLMNVEIWFW